MNKQFETVSQMVKDLTGIYRGAIIQSGVSENEFWIWYSLIEFQGDITQQDICSMWSISKQTVNTIITNLVKKELLTLSVIPGTRNRKKICPTEAGLEYGRKIVVPLFTAEKRAFDRMAESDIRALTSALKHFSEYFCEELTLVDSNRREENE